MKLEGIHHITCITADAPGNVHFYARVLGLRLVKKTVNQDDPTVYHLFYADELGSAGADITFFEYPQARRGRPGAGMIHTVLWRVASEDALDFWERRLAAEGVTTTREPGRLRFVDPEGLDLELVVARTPDSPLVAKHPDIPEDLALLGFHAVHAYASDPELGRSFFEQGLGFEPAGDGLQWEVRGELRGGFYRLDEPPAERGMGGAGTVHHVAWSSTLAEHEDWMQQVARAGGRPTPVIDRFYFRSIYFREPNGVLFEIATLGPGFATDEPLAHLGESLALPPAFEHLRAQIEPILTPLPSPRG